MRAVVQRVSRAAVSVAGESTGTIDGGFVVLLGVAEGDTREDALYLAQKIAGLRVFEDDQGKMNRGLAEAGGKMLVVSQFTLLGDCRKGRRPSFDRAARPETARDLYEAFVAAVGELGIETATGRFQEHMLVELVNDGPVTLLLDSRREF
ncbi:MAG: D-aminoacyl-tRNA deacylase [Deltaproteobacteria bacterium]